jgi:hypothetical protein
MCDDVFQQPWESSTIVIMNFFSLKEHVEDPGLHVGCHICRVTIYKRNCYVLQSNYVPLYFNLAKKKFEKK